jgi:Ni2+-binding GTPase involved in maturation of urease and hydrogenase
MELHLVGGFLGSGKTTAILSASRQLISQGLRVGIITNEQGRHLVDTAFLNANQLPALEVTGGCICCNLDDFSDRIEEIATKFNPDLLFAESVGSCADLVATVIKPLSDLRKTAADPTSLSVFSDSRLLLRWLLGQELPFSESVIYIFEKQLEEAGLIVANKADLLTPAGQDEMLSLATKRFPEKSIRIQNSLTEKQVADWVTLIRSRALAIPVDSLMIEYDRYAEGEAKFVWLDRELELIPSSGSLQKPVAFLIKEIIRRFKQSESHIAHIKFFISDGPDAIKISLTSMDDSQEKLNQQLMQLNSLAERTWKCTINLMVEGDRKSCETMLDNIIRVASQKESFSINQLSQFTRVPGRPQPTLRIG